MIIVTVLRSHPQNLGREVGSLLVISELLKQRPVGLWDLVATQPRLLVSSRPMKDIQKEKLDCVNCPLTSICNLFSSLLLLLDTAHKEIQLTYLVW